MHHDVATTMETCFSGTIWQSLKYWKLQFQYENSMQVMQQIDMTQTNV